MPAWAIQLIEAVLPLILSELVKRGQVSRAESMAVTFGLDLHEALSKVEFFYQYPGDAKPPMSESNITRG